MKPGAFIKEFLDAPGPKKLELHRVDADGQILDPPRPIADVFWHGEGFSVQCRLCGEHFLFEGPKAPGETVKVQCPGCDLVLIAEATW